MSRRSTNLGLEYQVALLGSTGVGKSSLALRYTKDRFSKDYMPTLLDNIYYKF